MTRFAYANASSILLGLVIERVHGATLPDVAEDEFFGPLRMTNTTFVPSRKPPERIVPTEIDAWRGREIRGEIHDESAWALRSRSAVGSAGLFSTGPDLLTFLEMLVGRGEWEGRRFLSSEILDLMTENQIPELDACTGLGWELAQSRFMGSSCGPRTFGKTGFTGCSCVCDMDRGVGIVLLSNHTYPRRRGIGG